MKCTVLIDIIVHLLIFFSNKDVMFLKSISSRVLQEFMEVLCARCLYLSACVVVVVVYAAC